MIERWSLAHPSPDHPTRLVYIPTHRHCDAVITAVAEEVRATSTWRDDDFQLLVLDDRPVSEAEPNRRHLGLVAEQSDFPIVWISKVEWSGFLSAVIGGSDLDTDESGLARLALDKPTGSYAGGMNKAALFAAFLDAQTLHRRDSDELPAIDPSSHASTLGIECSILDSQLQASPSTSPRQPLFAGTSVDGQPTRDHRDLAEAGEELVRDLFAITSRRPTASGSQDRSSIERVPGALAFGQVHAHEDHTGKAEVGVSATRLVHEWLPEMPAPAMIGTDHFQKGLLYQLQLPVIWHDLTADHRYDDERLAQSDLAKIARYAEAELRFAALKTFWNRANVQVRADAESILSAELTFSAEAYASAFESSMRQGDEEAMDTVSSFLRIYALGAERSRGALRERLDTRVDAMQAISHEVVPYVRAAIEEHLALVRMWGRLMASCRSLR